METQTARHPSLAVQIRWMIRRDMPEVFRIETGSFEFPWSDAEFVRCLRQRNCIGMVAEHDDQVVGFMIYELHETRIVVLNFAVAAACRRRGVGRAMADKLVRKLSEGRRREILIRVCESILDAHRFWRAVGWRAVRVERGWFTCAPTPRDAYVFRYHLRHEHDSA